MQEENKGREGLLKEEQRQDRQVKKRNTIEDARGMKRKPEDERKRADAKRQESMIVSCLSGEESTRRGIQEALRTRGRHYSGSVEERENKTGCMFQLRRTASKS